MRRTTAALVTGVVTVLLAGLLTVVGATTAQAASAWPVTKQGQPRNGNAMTLQHLLTHHGWPTTADGVFGSGTTTNLKSFQSSRGLTADGVAGAATWPELVVTVSQGSGATNAVRAAQTQLNKYGHHLVVDGAFGSATRSAVVSFQASRGLAQSGTVDLATWRELLGYSQTHDQTLCFSTGGSTSSTLTTAQVTNVQTILATTRSAGGNRNAQIITLMAAMQESRFCNIQFGDRDSLGLFQQRPSQGWCPGSVACMDPTQSTQGFLGVSSATSNRGLFEVSGWESMEKTLAADAVQRSCCPYAYAQWESLATTLADTY